MGLFAPGLVPTSVQESSKWYTYDPELAKTLLKEAGYPGGQSLHARLACTGHTDFKGTALCQAVARMIEQVGIDVEVVSKRPADAFSEERMASDLWMIRWPYEPANVPGSLNSLLNSQLEEGYWNVARLDVPVIDNLSTQLSHGVHVAGIVDQLTSEIIDVARDQYAYIPIAHPVSHWARSTRLSLPFDADGHPHFDEAIVRDEQ